MKRRFQEIVRQFPENGVKLLLEQPANVRDLLRITGEEIVEHIDFARLRLLKTHFVGGDYRHAASDVVLRAPFGRQRTDRRRGSILVYILIEHQSEPDRAMPLRLLEYMLQIYRLQQREERRKPRSRQRLLSPVLPLVFYTGVQRWDKVGSLVDLVESGGVFAEFIPQFESLFVNLPATSAATLTRRGGFLGWVLGLLKERLSEPSVFEPLLRRVVEQLEAISADDHDRWRELLSYVHAMVYHYREEGEFARFQKTIETSARRPIDKQEIVAMGRTAAEAMMAKGREEGRQEGREEGRQEGREEGQLIALRGMLLRQLGQRFGTLPGAVVEAVETTSGLPELEAWLDRVLSAETLDDVGIVAAGD